MRNVVIFVTLVALAGSVGAAQARSVTDSAGRTVTIPDTVQRVYAAGPPAAVLLYVLAPDRLIGWPRAPSPEDERYLPEAYRGLPETGRLTGRGNTANLEVVLRTKPDLIFDFGSVRRTHVSLADRLQAQTGIPYLLIDGRFEHTASALRLMGNVLGVPERAEELAAHVETLLADLEAVLADIPESGRPRVYLARTPSGLETGLQGSINAEIIERAGGRNVAGVNPDAASRRGLTQMSVEQLILANPDTIITWDRTFYAEVWSSRVWEPIEAVRQGRVFLAPTSPFGWIDRPPSVNRIIGLRWLGGLFYPDRMRSDWQEEARLFYSLFYHVDLTDELLSRLTD